MRVLILLICGVFTKQNEVSKIESIVQDIKNEYPRFVDHSSTLVDRSDKSIPKVDIGGRVVQLFHGEHFDDILKDTPTEMRPSALVAFYGYKSCPKAYDEMQFENNARLLPSRDLLFLASYDMDSAPGRAWYKFTPEMDLKKRFGVTKCPQIAFVPRSCTGETEWCVNKETGNLGCEDFKDQCTGIKIWDGPVENSDSSPPAWVKWARNLIVADGKPKSAPFFEDRIEQRNFMVERDETTTNTYLRNVYMVPKIPAFTETGRLEIDTPKEMQDWLLKFYSDNINTRKNEEWRTMQTQMNNHVQMTTQIDLDLDQQTGIRFANENLLPLLKNWTGIDDLELTSFFGIREYYPGHVLRPHIDRISTHVISVTISILRQNELGDLTSDDSIYWPLDVMEYTGQKNEYTHKAGKTLMYESSKLIHGRSKPLPRGNHVGAFCHYSPKGDHWKKLAEQVREEVDREVRRVPYNWESSEEGLWENEEYENTTHPYFEGTIKYPDTQPEHNENEIKLTFFNKLKHNIDVYWVSFEKEPVHNCRLTTRGDCEVFAGVDHMFFYAHGDFLDSEQLPPLPSEEFMIRATATTAISIEPHMLSDDITLSSPDVKVDQMDGGLSAGHDEL